MPSKHAIILAGGKGSRLRPYTTVLPKPLLPIGDLAVVEVLILQLRASGFDKITMVVASQQLHTFKAFLEDRYGDIELLPETSPLGTAGPIASVHPTDDFLLINGDTLTTLNFGEFLDFHKSSGAIATIAIHSRTLQLEYGVVHMGSNQQMVGYYEKPTQAHWASMGVYAFSPFVTQHMIKGVAQDIPDLMHKLMIFDHVQCWPTEAFWLDIGRPADYEKAAEEFERRRKEFLG